MDYQVTHDRTRCRFEVIQDGHTAYLEYELKNREMDIVHTVVPPPMEGKGIASALMKQALVYAKEQGFQVIPTCSFADAYLRRNKCK